jgi:hypothetical protein
LARYFIYRVVAATKFDRAHRPDRRVVANGIVSGVGDLADAGAAGVIGPDFASVRLKLRSVSFAHHTLRRGRRPGRERFNEEVRFAKESPVEGTGFEPTVPLGWARLPRPPLTTSASYHLYNSVKAGILLPARPRGCGLVLDEADRPETLLVLF